MKETKNPAWKRLDVFGVPIVIDYNDRDVLFPNDTDENTVQLIGQYLKAEGFIDDVKEKSP
jgi:hypothetical protein